MVVETAYGGFENAIDFFDDRQPGGEKPRTFFKTVLIEEGLPLSILAGASSQTQKLSSFFLFNHKKQPRQNTVVPVWLTSA